MIWGSLRLHELHVGKEKLSKTIHLTQLCASTTSYTTISWDQEPQSIHANCGSWTSFPKDTLTKIWPPILLKVTWLESLSQKQCNFYDKVWRTFSYRTKVPGHCCPMFHDLFTKITHSLTMSLTIILSTNTHWVPALCQVPTRQRWSSEILAIKIASFLQLAVSHLSHRRPFSAIVVAPLIVHIIQGNPNSLNREAQEDY